MSLRIGQDRVLVLRKKELGEIKIYYRAPLSDELNEYVAQPAATGASGQLEDPKTSKPLMEKRQALGIALIKRVEGLEPEDGYTDIETLKRWGGIFLTAFTRYVFETQYETEVEAVEDPGKSAPSSVRPLPVGSARSRNRRASGSNKSNPDSGTTNARPAQTAS